MHQRILIAILVVVIIILTGTTVYFATITKESQQLAPVAKVVQQATRKTVPNTQSTGDTVSWKTYSDAKAGFEFKYPQEWIIEPLERVDGVSVSEPNKKNSIETGQFSLFIVSYNNIGEIGISAEMSKEPMTLKDVAYGTMDENIERITFLGEEAYQGIFINETLKLRQMKILFSKNDHFYEISYDIADINNDINKKIISTLKFVN